MSKSLTDQLAETKRVCEAATPGPWHQMRYTSVVTLDERDQLKECIAATDMGLGGFSTDDECAQAARNADLIAHARSTLPRLVAALELAVSQRRQYADSMLSLIREADGELYHSSDLDDEMSVDDAELARVLSGETTVENVRGES